MTSEMIYTTDIKKINKNRIYRLIRYMGRISRQEIADKLELSLPTVNQNIKQLMDDNLIDFYGNFDSTGGRKAQIITVNASYAEAVSVNICLKNVKIQVINATGEIMFSKQYEFEFKDNDAYFFMIAGFVNTAVKASEAKNVIGVGITIPGVINEKGDKVIFAPSLAVRNYSLTRLKELLPYNVRVMNDATACAYVEYRYESSDFGMDVESNTNTGIKERLYLMLNTGVGGAYLNSEKIKNGMYNKCGEFGHMTLFPKGKSCVCGRKGCFESYVSANVLSSDLDMTLEEFFEKLREKDKTCEQIFEEYLDNLTTGINNLHTISDAYVVVGGPVSDYLKEYEGRIRNILEEKYSFDTDSDYFSFTVVPQEKSETGAALSMLDDYISWV